jgi:hypothetical protein
MPSRPPLPPAASTAIGLLVASLRNAARLPRQAARFPLEAARRPVRAARRVTAALPVPDAVRREYDALAERGVAVVSRLRPPATSQQPAPAAADAGAPGTATEIVEQAEEQVHADGVRSGAGLDHDDLPLPDFDHLTLGSLRGRLRRLSLAELVQLREYERAHGRRLPIVTMLDNRIAKLTAEQEPGDPSRQPR